MNTSEKKNKVKIEELFDKLRTKLSSFEVINLNGDKIGEIKNFTLDKNRRLYMVVPQLNNQPDSPVFLISTKYIQNVDPSIKTVFVDISQEDWQNLPLYQYANQTFSRTSNQQLGEMQAQKNHQEGLTKSSEDSAGEIVRLLEERLVVNRSLQKIGEVVVRKQIETRFIEVQIKREKLNIEKIDSETQQPVEFEQLSPEYFSGKQKAAPLNNSPVAHYDSTSRKEQDLASDNTLEVDDASQVVEEEIVRLLEERLVINRRKWKVGEVVVRKEVETETVQVPIRREKLIVEQVGSENKILAEIDLGKGEVTEVSPASTSVSATNHQNVVGEFLSPKSASNLLDAIALQKRHGCTKVRIELVVEDSELQETYQKMFDRCSTR